MEESFEEKCKRIEIGEEKLRKKETEKLAKAFCYERKTSTESFIELLENLNHEDRLNKIKSLSKSDLKRVAESLGKGVKADVHTINCLISNIAGYNKMRGK